MLYFFQQINLKKNLNCNNIFYYGENYSISRLKINLKLEQ